MQMERDRLIRFVFPELRQLCSKRRLHLIDVDLRWGVTQKESEQGGALAVCLDEIDRCRPFFIGLLGERYGFVPPRYEVPDEPRYDWLRRLDPGHSITALEIYHGVIRNPQMKGRAFFYFRDPEFIDSLPEGERSQLIASGSEEIRKLKRLKEEIQKQGNVREYATPDEQFESMVLSDLWAAILAEYPEESDEAQDDLAIERGYHDAFIEDRSHNFVGRFNLLANLRDYVDGTDTVPLLVTGKSGSGKSGLLSKFARDYAREHPDCVVLTHFIGASPSSINLRETLLRLCREVSQRFRIGEEIPQKYDDLRIAFPQLLACANGRLLLIVDALNQFETTVQDPDLSWLPHHLPENVRVIVSSLEGGWLEQLERRRPHIREIEVGPLQNAERRRIAWQTLDQYRKHLAEDPENDEMTLLLSKSEADRPLYLAIACEELRVLGDFKRVNERIRALPDSVAALIGQVLQRLEKDHGEPLIANALSLIACSRHGLLESELLELLKRDGEEQLPQAIWARAYRSLKSYLRSPGNAQEGEIGFFHQQLQWAAEQRYLPTPEIEAERHLQLAQYFRAVADPERDASFIGNCPRAFAELPYQLCRARKKEEVEDLLLTCSFLESKVDTFGPEPLIQDYDLRVIRKAGGDSAVSASEPHRLVQRSLTQSSVPLLKDPSQLASQLYARLLRTDEKELRTFRQELRSRLKALIPLSAMVAQADDPFLWRVEVNRYVSALAVSQDGRVLFSGSSEDSIIRMWDIDSRREMRKLEGHKDEVTALALSGDAHRLFSASRDKTIRVWDVERGSELHILHGHTEWVRCLALSRDEGTLFSAALDSTVRVWDVESGRELRRIDGCKPPFALSDDQRLLFCQVSAGIEPWDNVIRVWDLTANRELCRLAENEETFTVMRIVCGADGRSVFSACGDKTVRAWDVDGRREVRRFLGHRETVYSLALSADGRTLFTGSLDNTIRAWDTLDGRELYRIAGHGDAVDALALSTKRAMLFSGSADRTIRGWDLTTGPATHPNEGHTRSVTAIAFDRSGRLMFSGSYDRTIRAWDLASSSEIRRFEGHENYVTALAVSEDGSIVYSASWDATIRKWSVLSGLELQQFDATSYPLTALVLSRDGKTLVSAQEDGSIAVWDIERGCALRNFEGCHWDIEDSTKVVLALTADGRRLFSGDGNIITVTEMADSSQTRLMETAYVTALALSTDEQNLYCGSSDHMIRVLDAKNGHELRQLEGHSAQVTALLAIADGHMLISASVDCMLKVWQVESGECTATFHADAGIVSLASGPSGIVAAGDDAGHVGLFRIDTSASVRRSASA